MNLNINSRVELFNGDKKENIGQAEILGTEFQRGYQTRDRVPLAMGETTKFVIDCPELEDYIEEWGNLSFKLDEDEYLIPEGYVEPDTNNEFWLVEVTPLN